MLIIQHQNTKSSGKNGNLILKVRHLKQNECIQASDECETFQQTNSAPAFFIVPGDTQAFATATRRCLDHYWVA